MDPVLVADHAELIGRGLFALLCIPEQSDAFWIGLHETFVKAASDWNWSIGVES